MRNIVWINEFWITETHWRMIINWSDRTRRKEKIAENILTVSATDAKFISWNDSVCPLEKEVKVGIQPFLIRIEVKLELAKHENIKIENGQRSDNRGFRWNMWKKSTCHSIILSEHSVICRISIEYINESFLKNTENKDDAFVRKTFTRQLWRKMYCNPFASILRFVINSE